MQLLYYTSRSNATDVAKLPLIQQFKLNPVDAGLAPPVPEPPISGLGVFRSAWNSTTAAWVGFKGGDVNASHGHLDIGSFVFTRLGVRWAEDLGSEAYVDGYFDKSGPRFTFYRANNTGHNTLTLNGNLQYVQAKSNITLFQNSLASQSAWAIIDMTNAYSSFCTKVRRGIALVQQQLIILDQLEGCTNVNLLEWLLHTKTKVFAFAPGSLAPINMTLSSKNLQVKLLAPPTGFGCSGLGFSSRMVSLSSPMKYLNMTEIKLSTTSPGCTAIAVALADATWNATARTVNALDLWDGRGPFG